MLNVLRTEIRHYSYRTEMTYLDWVHQFLAFHGYADPMTLTPAKMVKEYPDYLAVGREVAASTQNQTLNALEVAVGAARAAGAIQMENFGWPSRVCSVSSHDVKLAKG